MSNNNYAWVGSGSANFEWTSYYREFADKLMVYADKRSELVKVVIDVFQKTGIKLPTLERDNKITDMDPFTVFALFNKSITVSNRTSIMREFSTAFQMKSTIPENFDGIPVLTPQSATFYWFEGDRGENDIENLWTVFKAALAYAEVKDSANETALVAAFDVATSQSGVKWNLTMGLYWARPDIFVNLDKTNRDYLVAHHDCSFAKMVTGSEYVNLINALSAQLATGKYPYNTFSELSHASWEESRKEGEKKKKEKKETVKQTAPTKRYWIYSPGDGASMWEDFYAAGIMCIGWGDIGSLTLFESKDDMKSKMKEAYGADDPYTNAAHATWQFANDMKPGDVVFAKKGMYKVVGCGIVLSEYEYDDSRDDDYRHVRKVDWTHKGEWDYPGIAAMKTLTDITSSEELVEKLCALFSELETSVEETEGEGTNKYTREDFLKDVYMSPSLYDEIVSKLKNKKNIILQGPPGVGKTYAATRLAQSIMGQSDPERIMMVQFHQSYGYEDFIMGFRPCESGFKLSTGPFYNFCKRAASDCGREYFFIIDEINRGNLSKIFGELFVLLEGDKRGMEVQLLYRDEKFTVPANIYIIGMMNTADRSLAIMDFALRRRFAFFEFKPAFSNENFLAYLDKQNNDKFSNIVSIITDLNAIIEADDTLGRGFCIGHSYFCTNSVVDDEWLKSVVEYEIIPLLEEYWFDEPSKWQKWANVLREAMK